MIAHRVQARSALSLFSAHVAYPRAKRRRVVENPILPYTAAVKSTLQQAAFPKYGCTSRHLVCPLSIVYGPVVIGLKPMASQWLTPTVHVLLAVDAMDPFVIPEMPLNIPQIQKKQAIPPRGVFLALVRPTSRSAICSFSSLSCGLLR